jgi:hypothetical protein
MADVTWRIGAFASQYPQEAKILGRGYALEDEAAEQLFETAGQVPQGSIQDALCGGTVYSPSGSPEGCCGSTPCAMDGTDTACARGTCCCADDDEAFEAIYPEIGVAMAEGRALAAAVRDILTDPDIEDVAAPIAAARELAAAGQLAILYAPAVPAKKLPDGTDAPARCPICGACTCPTCGCTCCCVG